MPGSLQGEYTYRGWRACVHTPSGVASSVGRRQLHPQGSSTCYEERSRQLAKAHRGGGISRLVAARLVSTEE